MNLNQLYYFQTLAKLEHYTKASEQLYIAQPSLTHAMKELEQELGVTLFIKKGRNIQLSPEGKIFLEYVNQSLETLNIGINELKNHYKDNRSMIEIGVIPTIVNTYFAPIIKQNPTLDIKFRTGKTLDIIKGVKNNLFDFGICSKVDDPSLTYLPLLYEELVLITAKNHPLTQLKHITPHDIVQYPIITYQKEISIYQSIMDYLQDEHFHIAYELDDESSIASMVALDFGVAIVANNDLLKPFHNIEIVHLDIHQDSRIIYLVYNSHRKLSQTSQKFIDKMISNDLKID